MLLLARHFLQRVKSPTHPANTFFSYRQAHEQSNYQFQDALRCIAEDGDLESMTFQDALCLQYVQGVLDDDLKKKLCTAENPSLEVFNRILDADQQAQLTVKHMSSTKTSFAYCLGQPAKKSNNLSKKLPF